MLLKDTEGDRIIIHDVEWSNGFEYTDYQDTILFVWTSINPEETQVSIPRIDRIKIRQGTTGFELYRFADSEFVTGTPPTQIPILSDTDSRGRYRLISPLRINGVQGTCDKLVLFCQNEMLGEGETYGKSGFVYFYKEGSAWTIVEKYMPDNFMLDLAVEPDSDGAKIITTHSNSLVRTWEYHNSETGGKYYDEITAAQITYQDAGETPFCVASYSAIGGSETLFIGTGKRAVSDVQTTLSGRIDRYNWGSGTWVLDSGFDVDFNTGYDYFGPHGIGLTSGSIDFPSTYENTFQSVRYLDNVIGRLIEVMDRNDILVSLFEGHSAYKTSSSSSEIQTGRIAGPYALMIPSSTIYNLFYAGATSLDCLYSVFLFAGCEMGQFAIKFGKYHFENMVITSTDIDANGYFVDDKTTSGLDINEEDVSISHSGATRKIHREEFSYYLLSTLNGKSIRDNDYYIDSYIRSDIDGDGYVSMTELYNYVFNHDSGQDYSPSEIAQMNDNGDGQTTDGKDDTGDSALPTRSPWSDGYFGELLFI